MLFTSGDYPLFLIAVFLLYALARAGRGWGVAARLALMTLLGDVIYLLVTKDVTTLWDPIGAALLQFTVRAPEPSTLPLPPPDTWAPVWHYVVGSALLGLTLVGGWRGADAIASIRGQRLIARLFAVGLAATGVVVLVLSRAHCLADLTAWLSAHGHLIYLAVLGAALGASMGRPKAPLGRLLVLFLVSCLFYHAWAVGMVGAYRYLLCLILGIVVLDYHLALWIERSSDPRLRKLFLIGSLVSNLGVLALFKYTDFFTQDVLHLHVEPLHLILPAGISFHTFQSLSYTIDVYRRQLKATTSVVQFATFVMFFPQLVAGPIVRADELLPQLADPPPHDARLAADGFYRIAIGLFKKIGISDFLSLSIVDRVFADPSHFSSLEVLVGVYAYAFQIFLDFSAYSDIAIGSAQLLGFTLPENFKTPYRSANLQEFWRRWHMSLSRWLRDYLYIPLGGSRGSEIYTYRNLVLTMLLGGLWHGASWTFIVWGALHGGGLAVTRVFQREDANHPERAGRSLALFAAIAAIGAAGHLTLLRGEHSPWIHLGLAWAYTTPLWAALTAWLSRDEQGPAIKGTPRPRWALALRLLAISCVLGFGRLLYVGADLDWTLIALAAAFAAACLADVVEVGPDLATAAAWTLWAAQRALAILLVFHYVCLAWIFFRAQSFEKALDVLRQLGRGETDHANVIGALVIALAAATAAHLVPNRTGAWLRERFVAMPPWAQGALLAACGLALRELAHPKIVPFIYFQF